MNTLVGSKIQDKILAINVKFDGRIKVSLTRDEKGIVVATAGSRRGLRLSYYIWPDPQEKDTKKWKRVISHHDEYGTNVNNILYEKKAAGECVCEEVFYLVKISYILGSRFHGLENFLWDVERDLVGFNPEIKSLLKDLENSLKEGGT
jgi:hypothetical protein